jgi:hypothetical protein
MPQYSMRRVIFTHLHIFQGLAASATICLVIKFCAIAAFAANWRFCNYFTLCSQLAQRGLEMQQIAPNVAGCLQFKDQHANLCLTTNVITITTGPEQTGTFYTAANRLDTVDGNHETNSAYETSISLVPERVNFVADVNTILERGDTAYAYSMRVIYLGRRIGLLGIRSGSLLW